jgi:pimeloyl-ACP methyl ester carboxylesterase
LSPTRAPDALFTFGGGPGLAEASDVEDNAESFAAIRADRDIVMVDQRGTGKSNPLNCSFGGLNDLVQAFLAGDLPREKVSECRTQLEPKADLRFYTTPFAADDLDEVRRWLGYEKINIYGGSYGSRAALVYLDRHPQHVRTATLRAVFPLSLKNPLYSPRDAQKSIDRLFVDCAAEDSCRAAFPRLREDLDRVLVRLAEAPVDVTVTDPRTKQPAVVRITRDVFAGGLRRLLYSPSSQKSVPFIISRAAAGDFKLFEPILLGAAAIERVLSMGLFLSVTCAEDVAQIRDGEIDRATRGTFAGDVMVTSLKSACSNWPRGILPADYHKPVSANVPVLLLSGALDPMTPARYGEEVARYLPNSRHIVMEGIAHNPFPDCAVNMMTRLIAEASIAGLDTSCVEAIRRPAFTVPKP